MKKYIYQIKQESEILRQYTDEELGLKIHNIKQRSKILKLDQLLVEWFAIVQEVAFRKLSLRHFDTQLLAGIYLYNGKIVEMKTGEGKTLASTLPVALNALTGKGVHVITVNDYLAERDRNWMGKIYENLDLTVGLIKSGDNFFDKRKNYQADITYLTNSEVVFDYLRDSTAFQPEELVQRPFFYALLDEIDSILIDEARTPLILSIPQGKNNFKKLFRAKTIANLLQKDIDFQLDKKKREINLTEKGYYLTQEKLGKENLYDLEDPWILEILNALKAKYLFQIDKDYIILNNKIVIIDEFTGRIMEDRRWSMGIHEAIEMKENLSIGKITKTKISITYQNFFTLYPTLAGMTGTGKTAEKEFRDIYGLDVVVLPTAKPMIRKDFSDLVYQNEFSKWKAILSKAKECFEKGQPILIGTSNVEKSEFLSELFTTSGIPHEILNAKPENLSRESEIIAQAGKLFSVTIATNMAGRGTDIILGGNPTFKVKQILISIFYEKFALKRKSDISVGEFKNKNHDKINLTETIDFYFAKIIEEYQNNYTLLNQTLNSLDLLEKHIKNIPYSLDNCFNSLRFLYNFLYEKIYMEWQEQNIQVKNLGGLFVLGTERHETRRIDNQLRGRAGRQGDPGISQFFISLEDELIKIFGNENIRRWISFVIDDPDNPLESSFLTKSLDQAQEKVELYNYEIRKNVFQYDEIINSQRKQFFEARKNLLTSSFYHELGLRFVEFDIDINFIKKINCKNKKIFLRQLERYFSYFTQNNLLKNYSLLSSEIWIGIDLRFAQSNIYQSGFFEYSQNLILLSILDTYWTDHIEKMDYIRDTISWRSYGQQNPLIEYNFEAFDSYQLMLQQIRNSVIYFLLEKPIYYFE